MNINRVEIAGNFTRDPETRYTPKGTCVVQFGVAINRYWKDKDTGEKKEQTTFVDCYSFGKTAEQIAANFKKGKSIYCVGRLYFEKWEDKETGKNRQKLSVVVAAWQFVGKKEDDDTAKQPTQSQFDGEAPEDDDVPF